MTGVEASDAGNRSRLELELDRVVIRFGSRAQIGPVSAKLGAGEVLGLVGANGSGKTSIMRAICALQAIESGRIRFCGENVEAGVPVAGLGAIIEEPRFYPWLSASQNLVLAAGGRRAREERIDVALKRVGLATGSAKVATFSQGMRQRLGLARALLGDPRLLVLDEPTNGLDIEGMAQMRALIAEAAAGGSAVVLASHMGGEIEAVADRVLALSAGQPILNERTETILARWGSVNGMYEEAVFGSGAS